MRAVVASAMVLVLVSVIALCPAVACPLMAASQAPSGSCCHKPQTHPDPCPAKSVPDCPYSILQKSKTSPTATQAKWVGSIARMDHSVTLPVTVLTVTASSRLVDVSGLFLRNRVLLI
jgi:hypothetical protein